MEQYEPSRILENPESGLDESNVQQYVEVGANTYVGTKDGIKYTLVSVADNKFKLCEISTDSEINLSGSKSSWSYASPERIRNDSSLSHSSEYKPIKLLTLRRDQSCKGQGDETGNSFILTPDSDSRFKNVDISIPENISEKDQIPIDEISALTYTTLVPKQEKPENEPPLSYTLSADTYFQVLPQTETPHRPVRFHKQRQRMPMLGGPQYPGISPILRPPTRGRGRGRGRGRKPRPVWYQYRAPIMQSTPNTIGGSNFCNTIFPLDITKNSSISNYNDSQASIEYPRVPNNTPTSEGAMLNEPPKIMDLKQWIPRMGENYLEMDARECHNEKERKRRLRIKNACQSMKNLLPCVSEKTDNATVFENAVNFISFVKETIGNDYDMEFLQQTCIY